MRRAAALLMLIGAITCAFAAKNPNKEQVQALIKEGKSLEAEDKLLEARAKYAEALKYNGASKEFTEVNKRIAAKAKEIVSAAKTSFEAKDYPKSIEQLQEASKYAPGSPDVPCDLGVVYHASGNDAQAVESLHACAGAVKKPEEKSRYEQLITQIETKDQPATLDAGQKQALTGFNRDLTETEDVLPTATADTELCKELLDNQATLPKTPAILLNLAKCAEDAGQLEAAAHYFSDYSKAAPDSRVLPEAQDAASVLTSILAFDGTQREEVRKHYGEAARYLARGRYDLALKEYEAVREVAPQFAYGRRQLSLFYEAFGRTDEAVTELNAYAALEGVPEEEKNWANKEIMGMAERRAKYKAAVSEASAKLRPILFKEHSDANGPVSEEAIKKLQEATAEFPLAPEANRLLGFLYVEGKYPAGAKRSYDSATASGADPFFFAWVGKNDINWILGKKDAKSPVFALVQVKKDGLQIEPLNSLQRNETKNKKGKKGLPTFEKKSELCEPIVTSPDVLVPATPCGDFLAVKDIHSIESKTLGLEIVTAEKSIWLMPVNLFQEDPVQYGPAARKFANRYVRVIQRYMENDITKPGAEHMTGGEKAVLGLRIVGSAAEGLGAFGGVGAVQAVIAGSMAALRTMQVLQQLRLQNAMIARTGLYRPIPVDPAPLAFRVE